MRYKLLLGMWQAFLLDHVVFDSLSFERPSVYRCLGLH